MLMSWLHTLIDYFLHMDQKLVELANATGSWLYAILFLVIFCETGLVVTPFLPGDSLLFVVGALAAKPEFHISLPLTALLMSFAAILGDAVNYSIGKRLGPKVFSGESARLLNKKHLMRAHQFYEKHGGKTIILARFIPIVRTFAPFVAGIGEMNYFHFAAYNIVGGVAWVCSFLFAGYLFGDSKIVKDSFHYVIVAIIVISVLPVIFEFWRGRREAKRNQKNEAPAVL
jgi:membrane-associated protein